MIRHFQQFDGLNEIMEMLYRVLDVRITFFDMRGYEKEIFHIKEMSPFCREFRKRRHNEAKCVKCDLKHLELAKRLRRPHIYNCHRGLLEGVVPIYDRYDSYVGAIVFGQLRDVDFDFHAENKRESDLYAQVKTVSRKKVEDIGDLLKLVSEYIIDNEIIRQSASPWVERIECYVGKNLNQRITIKELAELVGRSPSFLAHNFPKKFGVSPKQYILQEKMKKAREMLLDGESVRNTALDLAFYDEFHFSKRFKLFWGKSPKHYKKEKIN